MVHFLGIDLGSSYTKFAVLNEAGELQFSKVIKTLMRKKTSFEETMEYVADHFDIAVSCTTGYGRKTVKSDIKKTEIICASVGLSFYYPFTKTILDIGGEDIKVIESGAGGEVLKFHMNDKCAAGTGSFITEIAEKAELDIGEMSELAKKAKQVRTLNSFCTVFAKTEIISWKFDGVDESEIALGIYLSIVNRIKRMHLNDEHPLILCGGVVAYHPYLAELLGKEMKCKVIVPPYPQLVVAIGAAISAMKRYQNKR